MPRPTSTHVLASQLEQAMTLYAAARTTGTASSPSDPETSVSSLHTLSTTSSTPLRHEGQSRDDIDTTSSSVQGAATGAGPQPPMPPLQPASPTRMPHCSVGGRTGPGGLPSVDADDDELEAELADFGYGSRRRPVAKKESLFEILNSEPPPWLLDDHPSSSAAASFSLEPAPSPEFSKRSLLAGKLRRRLRASTLTAASLPPAKAAHRQSRTVTPPSASMSASAPRGSEGLTTLRNSKSSGNLLSHLTRRTRGSTNSGDGRSGISLSSSPGSARDPRWPGPPLPQMLPFDLPPLTIPAPSSPDPVSQVLELPPHAGGAAGQSCGGAGQSSPSWRTGKLEAKAVPTGLPRPDELSTRGLERARDGRPYGHDEPDRSSLEAEEVLERAAPVENGDSPSPAAPELHTASVTDTAAASSSLSAVADRPRSTRPAQDQLPQRAGAARGPEPLRTDSDESVISFASIQKSPTRGPLPRRISRKPGSASTTADTVEPDRVGGRVRPCEAVDFSASPTEEPDLFAPRFGSWPPSLSPRLIPSRMDRSGRLTCNGVAEVASAPVPTPASAGDDVDRRQAARVRENLGLLQQRISAVLASPPSSGVLLVSPESRAEVAALASRLARLLDGTDVAQPHLA